MHGELVAFDLETTGLDPAKSEIIEIGIARFLDGQVIDRYQTFVKPSVPIPTEITHLTGIHEEDVEDAPRIEAILGELEIRFGDAPVIAHNVGFDVSFMRRHGLLESNSTIDTLELAAIVLPSAPRYNLNSLATAAGIMLEKAHRALHDAEATGHLYWHLWERVLRLPSALLAEIVRAAQGKQWDLLPLFQSALTESLNAGGSRPIHSPFYSEELSAKALEPSRAARGKIDESLAVGMLSGDGPLQAILPGYETRESQQRMAREVATALNQGEQVMIEAGTGTGKSLAYLVPAALWASENDQRVVVSTHTIHLQEQLMKKDIPIVKGLLDAQFEASIMKGRGNYLCPRRLEALRRRGPANLDELRAMAKVLIWMQNGTDGDRGDLNLRAGEWNTWNRVSAQDEDCTSVRCDSQMHGACPYYRARKKAETAHVLITNHALLIADARIDNRTLPEYFNVVIDEAHHLEDAITDGLSSRVDQGLLLARFRDIGGTLTDFMNAARGQAPSSEYAKLESYVDNIHDTLKVMNANTRNFFRMLFDYVRSQGKSDRQQMRLLDSHRDSGGFANVQTAWKRLEAFFLAVADALEHLSDAMPRYKKYTIPDLDDHQSEMREHRHSLRALHERLEECIHSPDSNMVYAITLGNKPEAIRIQIAPLHVGPMMEKYLNQRKESIVLTSATLRTQGNFAHLKERLYADDFRATALDSPFDYKRSTLVYIPEDIPEPRYKNAYQKMVERGIIELAAALEGRLLALFTSYAQLRETSRAISPRLKLGDIVVYDQSFGASRDALLEGFKSTERAVLMGTRSFWEGIDIPGDELQAVAIVRLPFAVPSNPIFSARAEKYENAFQQYAIPDAILRFRQGFGRLIRSSRDRGVVAVFDSRIIGKSYGHSFLESLPDCTVQYGPLDNLPKSASDWIMRG